MRKTAIYSIHVANNAKIVDFAGWQMPISYFGIIEEHLAVRKHAGLFDVSHMGEILVRGKDALNFCQFLSTNDLSKIKDRQAQYSLMCNNEGGVIDDLLIYKVNNNEFLFCVNASNTDKDFNWMLENRNGFDVKVDNVSFLYSQLALQGPESVKIVEKIFGSEVTSIRAFHFEKIQRNGWEVLISRTGYTGEDGFEMYVPWDRGPELWNNILEETDGTSFLPCGLGSRDTLRLEMGYSLYGCEIDESINPLEAGLQRYVKFNKGSFIGRESLEKYSKAGFRKRLVTFEMIDRAVPRKGYKIYSENNIVGYVTSGTFSPSLKRSIGLGMADPTNVKEDVLSVDIRGKKRLTKAVPIPFYRK